MTVFVDTSVWYAAANGNDARHVRAKEILIAADSLVTSNVVLAESWRLIRQRVHFQAAEGFWGVIRGGAAQLEVTSAADIEAAWLIGQRFPDQDFSFADRTSFAMMERLNIYSAASFDNHFAIYRYGARKSGAFEVLS
jgi:predicted nucleic acid-binding protein